MKDRDRDEIKNHAQPPWKLRLATPGILW